jgi:predicted DNA binding CopG/RHH family protein
MARPKQKERLPHGRKPKAKPQRASPDRGATISARFRDANVSLDAEDIALARLQAHLRKAEAIQAPTSPAASTDRRTTVRLPDPLLTRLRERARLDGVTASQIVARALDRFLRLR